MEPVGKKTVTGEIPAGEVTAGMEVCDPGTGMWSFVAAVRQVKGRPDSVMLFLRDIPGRIASTVTRTRVVRVRQERNRR